MILEIDNVELSFTGRHILQGVYLKSETGKVTGVLGRNGCGKSSLLAILFGSIDAKYSNIRINGKDQNKKLYATGLASYLPQHRLLPKRIKLNKAFNFFSVNWESFIAEFPSLSLNRTSITSDLSSGELRLIETYLVLMSKQHIILLDEPFSYIAPIYVNTIKELIQKLKHKKIIIITDHFCKDIFDLSEEVYFIKNGSTKLVQTIKDFEHEGYLPTNPYMS
ncbi:ABC-type lipopolysaccharide export system ATPase subunit [Flavobacteriaceae bacterium MAR_2009_75]|nr:ABC-type lipopolysaccharide export system ATPase subunit [Flavobacteriaceae bacterium MAR_2009_75]